MPSRLFRGAFPVKPTLPIPREKNLSVEDFRRRYLAVEHPVVLVGAAREWPAFHKWTREHLKAVVAGEPVTVDKAPRGKHFDYVTKVKIGEGLSWPSFIDTCFDGDGEGNQWYLGQAPLANFPSLVEDAPTPPFIPGDPLIRYLWIGTQGNVTRAHYDTEDNILVQLRGRKRVVLFPSRQHDRLYPSSPFSVRPNFAQVNLQQPDLSKFPRFKTATPWEGVLEPGDMLYLPIYWWHEVYSLEAGVSVNFWWGASPEQAMRVPGLRYWPKMAKEGYLASHMLGLARRAVKAQLGRLGR